MSDRFLSEENITRVYRSLVNELTQVGKTVDDAAFYPTFCGIVKSIYPRLCSLPSLAQKNETLIDFVLNRALNPPPVSARKMPSVIEERIDREDNSDIEARFQEALKLREDTNQQPAESTMMPTHIEPPNRSRPSEISHSFKAQSSLAVKRTKRTILCTVGANVINARNVHSIQLTSAVIPNTEYTVSRRNNRLYFRESSTEETWLMAEINEGNYDDIKDVLAALVSSMNMIGKCTYRYVIETQTGKVKLYSSYQQAPINKDASLGPRLPGGENAQYIPDTFQLCFGSSNLYAEQSQHLGNILGFDCPQVYNSATSSDSCRWIQSTHPALLRECEAVVVKFDEIPDISLLVPLHSQKGRGYFYCPKYAHRVQVGHYENLPSHERFLPNIKILTLSLTNMDNDVFDLHGATPAIEIEIESIDDGFSRSR